MPVMHYQVLLAVPSDNKGTNSRNVSGLKKHHRSQFFNISLLYSVDPRCFKKSITVPVHKKTKNPLSEWLPPRSIHLCHHEVLWEVKTFITSSHRDSLATLICIQTTQTCRWRNHPCPPHCPILPGPEEHMRKCCSLTIVQCSVPLCPPNSSSSSDTQDYVNRSWTSDEQTPGYADRHHIALNTECPSGVCAQPSPVNTVDTTIGLISGNDEIAMAVEFSFLALNIFPSGI